MANRLFVVIFLQSCLYHVVFPSSYVAFATSREPKLTNQLDIRTIYPGLHSTTGYTGPYSPESAPILLDQEIRSQIVSSEPLSSTPGKILPNPGPSNYQTKRPGSTGGFIHGIFQAADNGLTGPGLSIGFGPACGCTSGLSESGRNNFHQSVRSDGSGRRSREHSVYRNNNEYDDFASGLSGSTMYYGLGSRLGESVSSNCRSGSNVCGSCCNLDGSTKSYSGLGCNCESVSSKAQLGSNFVRPYDVSTSTNSGLGCNIGESDSSKNSSGSNFAESYCSYDGLGNSLGEIDPSNGRLASSFGGSNCSYGSKHHHGSTNSIESTNRSDRMGSFGGPDHGAVAVAGELPVVGRTTVVGRVPIAGGVKFNGFIPAAGRVTIVGSCYCGPPFAF